MFGHATRFCHVSVSVCVCVCVVLWTSPARSFHHCRNRPDQTDWIFRILIDKINAEKVQNQTAENKVCKRSATCQHFLRSLKIKRRTYRSCETSCVPSSVFPFALAPFAVAAGVDEEELVCIRKLAVRTNWPTAAENPARKALNGYTHITSQNPSSTKERERKKGGIDVRSSPQSHNTQTARPPQAPSTP
jgi:hypothetical protein